MILIVVLPTCVRTSRYVCSGMFTFLQEGFIEYLQAVNHTRIFKPLSRRLVQK